MKEIHQFYLELTTSLIIGRYLIFDFSQPELAAFHGSVLITNIHDKRKFNSDYFMEPSKTNDPIIIWLCCIKNGIELKKDTKRIINPIYPDSIRMPFVDFISYLRDQPLILVGG